MSSKKTIANGFTLIEILVGAAITLVIAGALVTLTYILGESRVTVFQNYIDAEKSNANISTTIREIRNARQGENGSYALITADDQEFIFFSDIDYDGQAERVRYTLNGTDLEKGVTEPSGFPIIYDTNNEKVRVITEYVRNSTDPIFFYYNGDWPEDTVNNPLPTPSRLSDTKIMQVVLRINVNPDDASNDFVLESYVQLRNLKENL
ncbi:type II secretion system protein J [Patescibacteria group bacterium]